MPVIWQSKRYAPELVKKRYIRALINSPGRYLLIEVGDDNRYDIRQSGLDADAIPQTIREQADKMRGNAFGNAEWPVE